jgi:hypothetical protein
MQQGILARLTLTSCYRNGHDPTWTKTSPQCAEGYHPTRTKYELVGEHEENELFQSSLRTGGHERKMIVGEVWLKVGLIFSTPKKLSWLSISD